MYYVYTTRFPQFIFSFYIIFFNFKFQDVSSLCSLRLYFNFYIISNFKKTIMDLFLKMNNLYRRYGYNKLLFFFSVEKFSLYSVIVRLQTRFNHTPQFVYQNKTICENFFIFENILV